MCSCVTDRITGKKRLHFFVEFSHVSSQKCTWFAIEGIFLLSGKDRVCYVWPCCASGGFCYAMHRAKKSFSLDELQLKFQIIKTEKIGKFHIRENTACVCMSPAQTIANSQRGVSLKSQTLGRLVLFPMQNLCLEHLCPQLSNLVNRRPKISLPLSLPLSQHIC